MYKILSFFLLITSLILAYLLIQAKDQLKQCNSYAEHAQRLIDKPAIFGEQ